MALVNCFECRQLISDQAKTCVHCGARNAKYMAPDRPVLRAFGWAAGATVALLFVLLAYGCQIAASPEGKERISEREAVARCEQTSQGMKDDPRETRQSRAFIYEACDQMRRDYRAKWGRNP